MHKPLLVAAAALSAAALALAPVASAEGGAVKTKVHLNGQVMIDGPVVFFKGTIDSRNDRCLGGRKVVLRSKADDFTYGSDRTDRSGRFKIVVDGGDSAPSDGLLTASTKKVRAGTVVCGAGSDTEMLAAR